MLKLQLARDL
jgi:tRNA A-37 threonylcarbamoyl transferase component Bud32